MSSLVVVAPTAAASDLIDAIRRADPGGHVAVVETAVGSSDPVVDDALATMRSTLDATDAAATCSPVPADSGDLTTYPLHDGLPPPPSLAGACDRCCVLSVDAVESLGILPEAGTTAAAVVAELSVRLLQHGWRHVAAPGVAVGWDPLDVEMAAPGDTAGAWSHRVVEDLVGPANVGLETHVGWATSRLAPLRVVVDGACLGGDLHTGTQHVVMEVTRLLLEVRPDATVLLAVDGDALEQVGRAFAATGVDVVERNPDIDADVLYRPYQMLRVDEADTVMSVGRRRLIGQLDMIGFSNPFYHPSADLFASARNLQRALMRHCDGVTFISEYGRDAAVGECADLDPRRLHVVSCGADPSPVDDPQRPDGAPHGRFVLCLSATFWHKNRGHAIATFADLVATSGYEGDLVIAGPEPFYGRSESADREILERLPDGVAQRVVSLGTVTDREKWWLLEHADVVLYPSVVEGFGLVPFEAAAVGTPSLSYAGTAPGEILAGTSATIRAWSPSSWARTIGAWIADPHAGADVVAEITEVAAATTWRRCAELTWDAIDSTLALPCVGADDEEEGGPLSSVRLRSRLHRRVSALRFTTARVVPAVGRRARSLTSKVRDRPS